MPDNKQKTEKTAGQGGQVDAIVGQPCTWKDCEEKQAYKTWLNKFQKPWCHLCKEHHQKLDEISDKAIREGGKENIGRMLSAWVKANGGAKKMVHG
jgi:thiol-disulfide isomerase/thioredoxin